MNESAAFDQFDVELRLDPSERLRAEKCHNEITIFLTSAGLIVAAFLQGSFRRKTMIKPLRDIDKVVILSEALRGLSPDQVMDRIQAVLAAKYPYATFERTRHSLKIDFGDGDFCFDVVPAWESDTDDDDVMIADRNTNGWKCSNTRKLIRVVAERNKQTNGTLVHTSRMIKHLVAHQMDGVISGLDVESIAYPSISAPMSYAEACVAVLEAGAKMLVSGFTDPTGVDRISDRLSSDDRIRAQVAFAAMASHAREAHDLALAGDHDNAVREWHAIFGEPFTEGSTQTLASALVAASGGSITRSGNVSSTAAARQSAPPTRSWAVG